MLQIFPVLCKMYSTYQNKEIVYSRFKWHNRDSLVIFLVCFAFGMKGSPGTVGIPGCVRSGFQMGVLRLNLGYKKFGENIYEGREGEEAGVGCESGLERVLKREAGSDLNKNKKNSQTN